jgi:putative oxidoreductase
MSRLLNSEPLAEDLGLLVLRIFSGGVMLVQHGWPKLMHFTERMDSFADPIGLGTTLSLALIVFAETVCAALVTLGVWTRMATLPLIIGMGVAAFIVHGDDPFGDKEMSLFYLSAYLCILLAGSGRYALDRISFR